MRAMKAGAVDGALGGGGDGGEGKAPAHENRPPSLHLDLFQLNMPLWLMISLGLPGFLRGGGVPCGCHMHRAKEGALLLRST